VGGEFTLGRNTRVFNLPPIKKFGNSEFIFEIKVLKLTRIGEKYGIGMAQNRRLFFYNYCAKHIIHLASPTLYAHFNAMFS